jgi:SAM-dependent methyltransferase
MADCCDPNGLSGVFGESRARSDARSYRRKGLDRDARRIVQFLVARGIAGRTVLEIGGGVGGLEIELLRAGAARASNVEISGAYEPVARELAVDAGVAERIDHRVADFAADHTAVGSADAVVLHRVVCCYPHMPGLVRPAAEHARRWLVLTFPAERWWIRAGTRLLNAGQAVFRSRFRFFFHEPSSILWIARDAGLRPVHTWRGLFWQLLALERR